MQCFLQRFYDLIFIQGIMAKQEEYSVKELNELISRIESATSLSENEIEKEINRSYGYLAQTRSRGKVPVALYKLLQSTFKDALQNTRTANGGNYANGNGPVQNTGPSAEDLIRSKDETIEVLNRMLTLVEEENKRLKALHETNLAGLNRFAQIVSARVQTILDCHKLLRAFAEQSKVDPKKIEAASALVDKQYLQILRETVEAGIDRK